MVFETSKGRVTFLSLIVPINEILQKATDYRISQHESPSQFQETHTHTQRAEPGSPKDD